MKTVLNLVGLLWHVPAWMGAGLGRAGDGAIALTTRLMPIASLVALTFWPFDGVLVFSGWVLVVSVISTNVFVIPDASHLNLTLLPATWRQRAMACLLLVTLHLAAGLVVAGLITAATGHAPVSLTRAVGASAFALANSVLAARLSSRTRRQRADMALRRWFTRLLSFAMGASLGLSLLSLVDVDHDATVAVILAMTVTMTLFLVPDAWQTAIERWWVRRHRAAPVPTTRRVLEPLEPSSQPLLQLWWQSERLDILGVPTIFVVVVGMIVVISHLFEVSHLTDLIPQLGIACLPAFALARWNGARSAAWPSVRSVLARLPTSGREARNTGLFAGVLVGAVYATLMISPLLIRKVFGLTFATSVLELGSWAVAVFVLVMLVHLSRFAPNEVAPHAAYGIVYPFAILSTICLRRILPSALCLAPLTITAIYVVLGIVLFVRMGRVPLGRVRRAKARPWLTQSTA